MSWLIAILLMFVLFALNMRIYLAMFASILVYFLFFSDLPLAIAVQRIVAPTQNSSLLAIPFFILLGTLLGRPRWRGACWHWPTCWSGGSAAAWATLTLCCRR